jgi:hypothetical protein
VLRVLATGECHGACVRVEDDGTRGGRTLIDRENLPRLSHGAIVTQAASAGAASVTDAWAQQRFSGAGLLAIGRRGRSRRCDALGARRTDTFLRYDYPISSLPGVTKV